MKVERFRSEEGFPVFAPDKIFGSLHVNRKRMFSETDYTEWGFWCQGNSIYYLETTRCDLVIVGSEEEKSKWRSLLWFSVAGELRMF